VVGGGGTILLSLSKAADPPSPPTVLQQLQQLDHHPNWRPIQIPIPVFPIVYPPDPLGHLKVAPLRIALTSGVNAALEWLGDALINTAAALAMYRATNDPDHRALRAPVRR
jgi:hypothetical protein